MRAYVADSSGVWRNESPFQDYYSIIQASSLLGISPNAMYSAVREGRVEVVDKDSQVMISHSVLVQLAEKRNARLDLEDSKRREMASKPRTPLQEWAKEKRVPDMTPAVQDMLDSGELDFLDKEGWTHEDIRD